MSPTEKGFGGASPPAFTRTTITSKSPGEAVFIIVGIRSVWQFSTFELTLQSPCSIKALRA